MSVHATTINKVCLSGLQTIYLADLMIRAGEADDHRRRRHGVDDQRALPAARRARGLPDRRPDGRRLDDVRRTHLRLRPLRDGPGHRALQRRAHHPRAPGRVLRAQPPARRRGDRRRASSPRRSSRVRGAPAQGRPRHGRHRRGRARRDDRRVARPRCAAAFEKDGTITAGNASQISDGGGRGARDVRPSAPSSSASTPIGELVGYGQVAGPDASLLTQPSRAIHKAAAKAGIDVKGLDLFEINEAFAAVGLASVDDLGIDEDKVNVNGGAIALGHPVGHVGHAPRAHRAARTAPSRRRRGRGRPVRRRRSGRRRDPAHPLDRGRNCATTS